MAPLRAFVYAYACIFFWLVVRVGPSLASAGFLLYHELRAPVFLFFIVNPAMRLLDGFAPEAGAGEK